MYVFVVFSQLTHFFIYFFNSLDTLCKKYELSSLFVCFQFNFVGKLLGPKGNSLKRLQEETGCKMAVLGRGSMKDRQKVRTNQTQQ